jgi:hypothetical protein
MLDTKMLYCGLVLLNLLRDEELGHVSGQSDAVGGSVNRLGREDVLEPNAGKNVFDDSAHLSLELLDGDNSRVGGQNDLLACGDASLGGNSWVGKKQQAALRRELLRGNVPAASLRCNPDGVRLGMDAGVLDLPKQPAGLHAATGARHLSLYVDEAAFVVATAQRRELNALGFLEVVREKELGEERTALLKDSDASRRPHDGEIFRVHFTRREETPNYD